MLPDGGAQEFSAPVRAFIAATTHRMVHGHRIIERNWPTHVGRRCQDCPWFGWWPR